eukprot:g3700.t1
MTAANKVILSSYNTAFPVAMSTVHMFMKGLLAYITIRSSGRRGKTKKNPRKITKEAFVKIICPIGAMTGLDVALSNISFEYVDVSTYAILKNTTLAFTLIGSFAMGLRKISFPLIAVVSLVVSGVSISVYAREEIEENIESEGEELEKSTPFLLFGSFLVLVATACAAFRWNLTQVLVESSNVIDSNDFGDSESDLTEEEYSEEENQDGECKSGSSSYRYSTVQKLDTLNVVFYIAPASVICLLPFFILLEFPKLMKMLLFSEEENNLNVPLVLAEIGAVTLIGGVCAFLLLLIEVHLVRKTSSLTLSMFGIFKTVLQLLSAMVIFGDQLTLLSFIGLTVALLGILWYELKLNNDTERLEELSRRDRNSNVMLVSSPTNSANGRSTVLPKEWWSGGGQMYQRVRMRDESKETNFELQEFGLTLK